MKTHSGSSGIPLLFLYPSRKICVGGSRHAPAAVSPGMAWCPLYRGWVELMADLEGAEKKVSSRIPSSYHPVSSESLYRLCDRLCGLVVRASGYRYRGPGFDSRRYQIF